MTSKSNDILNKVASGERLDRLFRIGRELGRTGKIDQRAFQDNLKSDLLVMEMFMKGRL